MELEPKSLNIPLHRKLHWRAALVIAWCLMVAVACLVDRTFATVLAGSGIIGLPVVIFFLPHPFIASYRAQGGLKSLLVYLVLFVYLALSKIFLIPLLLTALERVFI